MNKNMLYGVLGLIAIAVSFYLFLPKKATAQKEVYPEVPESFRSYKNLFDGFETDIYLAEQIISSDDSKYANLKYYNLADSSLIVLTNNYSGKIDAQQPWMDTYLKLNKKGQIIDSLSKSYSLYHEVLGHLIAKEHYSSWALDGDETYKPYINASLDSSRTKAEMLNNFNKYYQEAEIVLYRDYFDRPTKTRTHIAYLFKDAKWFLISQQDILDFSELFKEFLPKPHYEKIEQLQLPFDTKPWVNSTNLLELVHYQKTRHHKEASTGAFNPTGYTRAAFWEGEAYLNLNIDEATIPFKLAMNQPEKTPEILSLDNGSDLNIFKHETLDFMVIDIGNGQLHCIRPKN